MAELDEREDDLEALTLGHTGQGDACLTALIRLARRFDPLPSAAALDPNGEDAPPDPRPDLGRDHARWTALLQLAWERDGSDQAGLFQALYALRQCGGAIVTRRQPLDLTAEGPPLHWKLLRGEMVEGDWQRFRHERLLPHKAVLLELLRGNAS
jgi:hypothetical protein